MVRTSLSSRTVRTDSVAAWVRIAAGSALIVGAGMAVGRSGSTSLDAALLVMAGAALAGLLAVSWRRERSLDVIGSLAFLSVCTAIPLVTLNALRVTHSMTLGDPLLVLAAGLVVLQVTWMGVPRGLIPGWLVVSGAGILGSGLLAAFRGNVLHDLVPAVELAITMVGVPVLVVFSVNSLRRIEAVVEVWLLAASVSAFVGIVDIAFHLGIETQLTGLEFVTYTHRASGLTLHPNHLALVSSMALPVAAIRASRRTRQTGFALSNIRNLLYVLLLAGGIMASGSRAGLAAAAVGVLALPLLHLHRRRSWALFATMALIAAAFGALTLDSSLASKLGFVTGQRLSGVGTRGSDLYRSHAYAQAVNEFVAHPIVGQGFQDVRTAHDIYLQLLQAGGVIALLAFLGYLCGVFATARRVSMGAHQRLDLSGLVAGFAASLIVWLVSGLVQNAVYDRYLYIPASLILAARAVSVTRKEANATPRGVPSDSGRGLASPSAPKRRAPRSVARA